MPALKMELELSSKTLLLNNMTTRYPNMERHTLKYPVGLRSRRTFVCNDNKLQAMTRE